MNAAARICTALASTSLTIGVLTGCAAKIDRFTVDRVVAVGTDVPDVGKVCALGTALAHPLASLSKKAPHKALLIAELVSGLCQEEVANEAELAMDRAKHNFGALGPSRASEITDARLKAERAHSLAAARYERSWQHLEATYGELGTGECPKIKGKDEVVYLLGLVGGTLALIHDKRGASVHGIPLDRLLVVARASDCLDDDQWWQTPTALKAGAWATIPGSAPEGVDPWALLEEAASKGEGSGVRVGRAMQALIAGNAGQTEIVEAAIRAHVASAKSTKSHSDWALLDQFALELTRHESDRLWAAAAGHRTEVLGALPSDVVEEVVVPDLFSGSDPFGSPAEAPAVDAVDDEAPEGDETKAMSTEETKKEETP